MDEDFIYDIEGEDIDDYDSAEDIDDYDSEDFAFEDYYEPDDFDSFDGEAYAMEDYYEPDAAEARYRRGYPRGRRAALRRRQMARRNAIARRNRRLRYGRARLGYGTRARPRGRAMGPYYSQTSKGPASSPKVRRGFKRVGNDVKQNRAAIQSVNLDNKVQADTFGRSLRAQSRRINRNEYALASSKVVDELQERFPALKNNEVIKTALPLAPLLFLQPGRRKRGIEGLITDPRVWAPAIAAGAALFSQFQQQPTQTVTITGAPPGTLATGANVTLSAVVRDSKGQLVIPQPAVTWNTLNPANATVVPGTGVVSGVAAGQALITATIVGTSVSNAVPIVVS